MLTLCTTGKSSNSKCWPQKHKSFFCFPAVLACSVLSRHSSQKYLQIQEKTRQIVTAAPGGACLFLSKISGTDFVYQSVASVQRTISGASATDRCQENRAAMRFSALIPFQIAGEFPRLDEIGSAGD